MPSGIQQSQSQQSQSQQQSQQSQSQQSQSQQSQSQQQSQKSIKRKSMEKFKISQDQYNRAVVNLEEDDLEILQYVFLEEDFEADDTHQQINQNLLREKMENGNYVEIKTKKMHVELKKSKGNRIYIQKVTVNPLFRREGVFKRFLNLLKKTYPQSKIVIESVINPSLYNYFQSKPDMYRKQNQVNFEYIHRPS